MKARVYRFRERVVVSLGDGGEFYLDSDTAAELGGVLVACAADVDAHAKSLQSAFADCELELGDNVTFPLKLGRGKP